MTVTTLKNQAMNPETRLASKVIQISRNMTATSGDVAYTGVGFVPTALFLFGAIHGTQGWSVCAVDSSKAGKGLANVGNTAYADQTLAIALNDASGAQAAIVKSFDSDGFTLTWTKSSSPTGTAYISIICFR